MFDLRMFCNKSIEVRTHASFVVLMAGICENENEFVEKIVFRQELERYSDSGRLKKRVIH